MRDERQRSIQIALQDVIGCSDRPSSDAMNVVYAGLRYASMHQLREMFDAAYLKWLATGDRGSALFMHQIIYVLLRYHYRVFYKDTK